MTTDSKAVSAVPIGDFAADTRVAPVDGATGTYRAELSEAWKVFYVFGGATMAVALRSAQAALARDDLAPICATATFAAPVPCGPITIDTRVMRSGRGVAQAVADLRGGEAFERGGESDVHLSAVFGAQHESDVSFVETSYPDDAMPLAEATEVQPLPEDSPFSAINYHEQTDWRPAIAGGGFAPQDWKPGASARSLSWHRLKVTPRLADGSVDPVSYCMPADVLGPAIFARLGPLGPENPPFLMLSLEISVQFIARTSSAWLLQHTRAWQVGGGYACGSVELWDPDRALVAIANQRAHIRPVDPSRFAAPDGTA